jgi:thioredoxin reductase
MNDVQRLLGYSPERAEIKDRKVHLHLRAEDGSEREIAADYVIAATGYKVKIERLQFLSQSIRSQLKAVDNTPVLSSTCESSVPGLYFVGIAAANSFGPVMRFAYGSDFAARTVARALAKSSSQEPAEVAVEEALAASK